MKLIRTYTYPGFIHIKVHPGLTFNLSIYQIWKYISIMTKKIICRQNDYKQPLDTIAISILKSVPADCMGNIFSSPIG
jgi:hypothetical protein